MSIETRSRGKATTFRVHYRDADGRHRSRSFKTREVAERYDLAIRGLVTRERDRRKLAEVLRDV